MSTRKRKRNNSSDREDMPSLLSMDVSEIILVDGDEYQPDCPWRMSDFNDDDQPRHTSNRFSLGNYYDLDEGEF
jgi:hypothetical protein